MNNAKKAHPSVEMTLAGIHTPLVFMFRLPPHGNVPTLTYTMPIGIADFFIIIVVIDTADRIFSKDSSFISINWR
jgi:hypothetical protein